MQRLQKWQERRDNQTHSTMLKEKKLERVSNRLTKEQSDALTQRRAESLDAEHERHKRMVEKVKLEKLYVQESRNKKADRTFS